MLALMQEAYSLTLSGLSLMSLNPHFLARKTFLGSLNFQEQYVLLMSQTRISLSVDPQHNRLVLSWNARAVTLFANPYLCPFRLCSTEPAALGMDWSGLYAKLELLWDARESHKMMLPSREPVAKVAKNKQKHYRYILSRYIKFK